MDGRTYYMILGVPRTESPGGIRSAYRGLAKKLHPDVAGEQATHAFQEITEAYDEAASGSVYYSIYYPTPKRPTHRRPAAEDLERIFAGLERRGERISRPSDRALDGASASGPSRRRPRQCADTGTSKAPSVTVSIIGSAVGEYRSKLNVPWAREAPMAAIWTEPSDAE
jgi:DnaJ domain